VVWLEFLSSLAAIASPSIVITNVPVFGAQGNLSGLVLNANPATNSMAVFIFVAGAWYSKPSCASQLTAIQPDGTWTANITTVASDVNATEVAAFLVPTNYDQPCADGNAGLTIPPQAEAVVYAIRVNPSARHFNFSDYGWSVKTSPGLTGPGPNYFSDSTNNVWVDTQGFLHLAICYTSNAWQCSEIISDRGFGYGQYRFTVQTTVNTLDPNVVVGLFTYSYDAAYNDREIDIELSRWDYEFGASDVADYAVAPYGAGQVQRFALAAGMTNSAHSFLWQPNSVAYQSLNGDFTSYPAASNVLQTWNCSSGIPPAGGEQVHLNLWLDNGNAPVEGQPVEIIISKFEFVPLGPPPPATLSQLSGLPGGPVTLSAQAVTDWHYQILSSTNLIDWLPIGTILATNNAFQFTDPNPLSASSCFYRALTQP
jgi:hypothetical protein